MKPAELFMRLIMNKKPRMQERIVRNRLMQWGRYMRHRLNEHLVKRMGLLGITE